MKIKSFVNCLAAACLFSACGDDSSTSPKTNNTEEAQTSSSSIANQPNSSAIENKEFSSCSIVSSSSEQIQSSSTVATKGFPANYNPDTGLLTDERDGEIYKTAKVGEQIWMAQGLRYMPTVPPKDCEYTYIDDTKDSTLLADYGRPYSWQGATYVSCEYGPKQLTFGNKEYPLPHQGICPKGWHVPDLNEWKQIAQSVNNHLYKLLSTNWVKPGYKGTDEFGFNVPEPINDNGAISFIILENTAYYGYAIAFNDWTGSTIRMETDRSSKTAETTFLRCLMD